MTLFEKYKKIQEIGTTVPVPFGEVSRLVVGIGHQHLHILGNEVQLSNDADFCSLKEARSAIEFYVKQLGGSVKWSIPSSKKRQDK